MRRPLTEDEHRRVRALGRLDPKPGGGYWWWPTDEAIALERELNGTAQEKRDSLAKFLNGKNGHAD